MFEVGEDLLDGALGDADAHGDFAQDEVGFGRERDQHVGVVGEKGPGACADGGRFLGLGN